MKKKSVPAIAALFICLSCASSKGNPQPPPCAQNLLCLLNQEAAANDPASIHKYSEDLIGLIVPNRAGQAYIDSLADRLARAESTARARSRQLLPEAAIANAFNDLMRRAGAPPSLRADTGSVERAREGWEKQMPALISREKNGIYCYPGESIFLLETLIENVGTPPTPLRPPGPSVAGPPMSPSRVYLSQYYANHSSDDVIRLFNDLAKNLKF